MDAKIRSRRGDFYAFLTLANKLLHPLAAIVGQAALKDYDLFNVVHPAGYQ